MKTFLRYASLNTLGMMGLSLYILADTFFISADMGADGLAALNLAIPIYSLIHGSGLMLGMGGATRYALYRSQNRLKEASAAFTHAFFAGLGLAALYLLAGLFLSEPLARLMGAEGRVLPMTQVYLKVILLFAPAFLTNQVMIAFIRNDGAPQLALGAMLAGSFANILLDYLFIFPLRGGILGAVIATGLAPLISLGVMSPHFIRKRNGFHLCACRPSPRLLGRIVALGLPSLITELSSAVVMILFNALMLALMGHTGVAAYGVVANLALVVAALHTGVAQGAQPLASAAYGQKDSPTLKSLLKWALVTVSLLSAAIYAAVLMGAEEIASIFNAQGDAALQRAAVQGLRLYFVGCLFSGVNIFLSIWFPAVDQAGRGQTLSLMRTLLLIPLALGGTALFGVTGLWLAFPLAEALSLLAGCFLLKPVT
ncbi:MAG: MATE family efflux transporter [Clostridia bacterium]|nr:MATE family efflux transporter [Clostridia bacterium]